MHTDPLVRNNMFVVFAFEGEGDTVSNTGFKSGYISFWFPYWKNAKVSLIQHICKVQLYGVFN